MKTLLISTVFFVFSMSAKAANILATDFVGRVSVDGVSKSGQLVVLHHKETNRTLRAYTNAKGRYHFANVRPDGNYTITLMKCETLCRKDNDDTTYSVYDGNVSVERKPVLGKTLQQNFDE